MAFNITELFTSGMIEFAIFVYTEAQVLKLEDWVQGLMDKSITKQISMTWLREVLEGMARLLAPLL